MVFTQVFTIINQTLGWIPSMHLERSVFDNLLGFNGCLFLDPLRFFCYHQLPIAR